MPIKSKSKSAQSSEESQNFTSTSMKEDGIEEKENVDNRRSNRRRAGKVENSSLRGLDAATDELDHIKKSKFSGSDLCSKKVRIQLASMHPMLEGEYFIDTSDTEDFYNVVFDHVFARKSGLYITGEFRVGKTKNILNSILRLKIDLPIIYADFFSGKRNHNQSKLSFCHDILNSFKYYPSPHQNPIEALPRYLITKSVMTGSRTCVLFVDEAQMLTVIQLRYLLEIWNELRREGFLLVTILVGQNNLDFLMQLTEQQDHGAVISRFFVNKFNLGGIHSEMGLKRYLSAYDNKLFYPIESKWSYSMFFRANAFDGGWRLESECGRLWQALLERSRTNIASLRKNGFRLAFINDAIHSFLIDSMKEDILSEKESFELWRQSVSSAASNDLLIAYVPN